MSSYVPTRTLITVHLAPPEPEPPELEEEPELLDPPLDEDPELEDAPELDEPDPDDEPELLEWPPLDEEPELEEEPVGPPLEDDEGRGSN